MRGLSDKYVFSDAGIKTIARFMFSLYRLNLEDSYEAYADRLGSSDDDCWTLTVVHVEEPV